MSAVEMTPSPETAPLLGRRKTASAWPRKTIAGICAVAGCVALAAAAKHGALGDAASVTSQKLGQTLSLGRTEDGQPTTENEKVDDLWHEQFGNSTTTQPSAPAQDTDEAESSDATDAQATDGDDEAEDFDLVKKAEGISSRPPWRAAGPAWSRAAAR